MKELNIDKLRAQGREPRQMTAEEVIADIYEIIARAGGIKAFNEQRARNHEFFDRFQKAIPALREQYPGQWAAMAEDGTLAIGNSHQEVFDAIKAQFGDDAKVRTQFLGDFLMV